MLQEPELDARRELSLATKKMNQLYQDLQGHVSIVQEERRQQEVLMKELEKGIEDLTVILMTATVTTSYAVTRHDFSHKILEKKEYGKREK